MIEWTPALGTGVSLIDEQHKALFQWLAELENAASDGRTLFGVFVLTRLKHYVREHFAAEEALMKSAGYAGLEAHAAEHAIFRARLAELQLKSIAQDVSSDTVEFLKDWLINHISVTDMAYVPCLKQAKVVKAKT